ncbi:cytochrome P450 [Trametes coccinea BRFM310]|uniref:Cytochrome P450 n=1 Tax=Trametes coccinea (strain BRFM310) TaxID=1353009 RepID=A0A1Y2IQD1_TRAC3|nr:cytochrome P450 [Trametes coccinea BRFM310]
MEDTATMLWTGVAVLGLIYLIKWKTDPLNSIPTVGGSSWPIFSLYSAIHFSLNSKKLLQEGYKKYYGSVFKVPLIEQWVLIVSGPKMVDELRRRPDEELSFAEGVEDSMQIRHTFGPETDEDPYHVDIIREKLTRSVPAILPDVIDELTLAVPEHIPAKSDEWLEVAIMPTMQQIIARASSRVFVGAPLCRNKEYLNLAIKFTIDIIKDKTLVKLAPSFLKPLVGKLSNHVRGTLHETIPHLKPIIDERWELMKTFGDNWSDKPNDMLQWIIDTAQTRQDNTYEAIARRILLVNFAAIHTSSNSMSSALYHLAERPDCLETLREEIEVVLREEGWTKNAMGKMWKLDSFLKESQRYNGIGLASLTRKALKDITLPDGTFVPRGSIIMAAADATHHDDSVYADSDVFDPWRFSRMREADGEGTKHQFVNTSLDYISFGHGKHACPGRFFAANELKSLMAFIILNYDLKLGGDGSRPQNLYWALNVIPAPKGTILFRKREVSV